MHSAKLCAATNKLHHLRCSHDKIEYNTPMATRTTTVNHSDLPCTCTSMDQYVDGLCPGCIEAADRDADLKEHLDLQNECIYPQPTGNWEMPFLREDGD